ncbi:hypothetical protein GH714_033411 [Hevea brasiliensis]|uniref:Leucine-rich repeat-containing N-terminal plant-type domain-containing protein n=1 Tax=Hevea brasiliensis TaxID=3981 RepID=A0A6A6L7Q1_HEVBR|nr:hypothetical protein GH714_033411 [Hevea brasiliensis]
MGVAMVLAEMRWCYGCWEQERIALLQLKPFFDSSLTLQNWADAEEGSDCCQWERVECSSTTGRVTQLSLNNTRDLISGKWYLNASLFLAFEELTSLYLMGNLILGFENEGFERLSARLSNLEVLDLSYNFFNESILPSLNGFSSLKSLNLGYNQFTLPIQAQDLPNFENLEDLFLDKISLNNSFLQRVRVMTSLKVLSLSGCGLTGLLPNAQGLCELINLQMLDVSNNDLRVPCPGVCVPSSFGNMSSLEILDLSDNQLSGIIPELLAIGCFSLDTLILSNNNLQGHIFSEHFNLTKLWWLQLDGNNFSGRISNCLSTSSLSILDLRDNHLSGRIPGWIGNLSYLKDLVISNNHLEGPIPLEFCQLHYLEVLDLSKNNVSGPIPSTFSNLEQIESLDLSYNNLEGKIPFQLTKLNYLSVFSVAHNNLSGMTPERTEQFATFDASSYEGNPYLCGLPLPKNCTSSTESLSWPRASAMDEDSGFLDMNVFYASFTVSYIFVLLGIS